MPFRAAVLITLILGAQSATSLSAAIIYQSGTLGETGITKDALLNDHVFATNVTSFNFAGARFHVAQPVVTTKIGGHFIGDFPNSDFFGAIVRLTSAEDLPDSDDLTAPDVLGTAILTFPHPSDEVFGNLSVLLETGWHALVFGSALFGTDGQGAALRNGIDIGTPSYVDWQPGNGWFELSDLAHFIVFNNHHFVVEGNLIPEPSSFVLLLTIGLLLATPKQLSARGAIDARVTE
jgi:hypothetical protein